MAVPARLIRTLQHSLGQEPADDLVNWMIAVDRHQHDLHELSELRFGRMDSRLGAHASALELSFSEFRRTIDADLAEMRQELRAGLSSLRTELTAEIARVREDLTAGLSAVRAELATGLSAVRAELATGLSEARAEARAGDASLHVAFIERTARLEARIDQRASELLKWSFVFWLGSVGAMVAAVMYVRS